MLACVRSTLSAAIDEAIRVEFESVVKEALGTPRLSDEETRRLFEENRETFEWLRDLALTKPGHVRFGPGQLDMDEPVYVHGPEFMPEMRRRSFGRSLLRVPYWEDLSVHVLVKHGRVRVRRLSRELYTLDQVLAFVGFTHAEYVAAQDRLATLGRCSVSKSTLDELGDWAAFSAWSDSRWRIVYADYEPRLVTATLATHWYIGK